MPSTSDITGGLQILSREECLALLPTVPIGRVVVTLKALPAVYPVSFAVEGTEILFVTGRGEKLTAALNHAVVAFEVDQFDASARRGWSVLVQGRSAVIEDESDPRWDVAREIDVWGNRGATHLASVTLEHVSGRLVGPWPDGRSPS